jgi:Fungal Zn(2)-Cys(6) binuclear cluster domain
MGVDALRFKTYMIASFGALIGHLRVDYFNKRMEHLLTRMVQSEYLEKIEGYYIISNLGLIRSRNVKFEFSKIQNRCLNCSKLHMVCNRVYPSCQGCTKRGILCDYTLKSGKNIRIEQLPPAEVSEEMRRVCSHGKQKIKCNICKFHCEHDRSKRQCKLCGKENFCIHNRLAVVFVKIYIINYMTYIPFLYRRKHECKFCGGTSICIHGKIKYGCRDCTGFEVCIHKKRKSRCKACGVGNDFTIECEHGAIGFCILCTTHVEIGNDDELDPIDIDILAAVTEQINR